MLCIYILKDKEIYCSSQCNQTADCNTTTNYLLHLPVSITSLTSSFRGEFSLSNVYACRSPHHLWPNMLPTKGIEYTHPMQDLVKGLVICNASKWKILCFTFEPEKYFGMAWGNWCHFKIFFTFDIVCICIFPFLRLLIKPNLNK